MTPQTNPLTSEDCLNNLTAKEFQKLSDKATTIYQEYMSQTSHTFPFKIYELIGRANYHDDSGCARPIIKTTTDLGEARAVAENPEELLHMHEMCHWEKLKVYNIEQTPQGIKIKVKHIVKDFLERRF